MYLSVDCSVQITGSVSVQCQVDCGVVSQCSVSVDCSVQCSAEYLG